MSRFHVPFPEAGADAYLCLTADSLEDIGSAFGSQWFLVVDLGLIGGSPAIISRCLQTMLHGEDEHGIEDAPWNLSLDEIGQRLHDAFYLSIKGKTAAQMRAEEITILAKQREILERMAEDDPEKFVELADKAIADAVSDIERQRRERIARRKAEAALKAEREADNSADSADIPAEPEPAS